MASKCIGVLARFRRGRRARYLSSGSRRRRWPTTSCACVRGGSPTWTCGPDNEASQRVAERCRFTREGLLRSHLRFKGGRRDTVVFALLAGELR